MNRPPLRSSEQEDRRRIVVGTERNSNLKMTKSKDFVTVLPLPQIFASRDGLSLSNSMSQFCGLFSLRRLHQTRTERVEESTERWIDWTYCYFGQKNIELVEGLKGIRWRVWTCLSLEKRRLWEELVSRAFSPIKMLSNDNLKRSDSMAFIVRGEREKTREEKEFLFFPLLRRQNWGSVLRLRLHDFHIKPIYFFHLFSIEIQSD